MEIWRWVDANNKMIMEKMLSELKDIINKGKNWGSFEDYIWQKKALEVLNFSCNVDKQDAFVYHVWRVKEPTKTRMLIFL